MDFISGAIWMIRVYIRPDESLVRIGPLQQVEVISESDESLMRFRTSYVEIITYIRGSYLVIFDESYFFEFFAGSWAI